jgi:hypothetical protein
MQRPCLAALLLLSLHIGDAERTAPPDSEGAAADIRETELKARAVPFCLPGEKVVCTLGPPPVCHCE